MIDRVAVIVLFVVSLLTSAATFHQWSARKKAESERDKTALDWAEYRAAVQTNAATSERIARERIQHITKTAAQANTHAESQIKALISERDEARNLAVRLYQRAQELAAEAQSCHGDRSVRAQDGSPGYVLADMHRRTDEAAAILADYADRLRIEIEALRSTQDALSK